MRLRYRFFLHYVPFLFVISLLIVFVADRYNGKAKMVSYEAGTADLGNYSGEVIRDGGTNGSSNQQEKQFYNGTDLKDNGLPYCIKVNKTKNVVTIYTAITVNR